VPVLEHGAKRLSQSGVILDYLVSIFRSFGWNNDDERREVMRRRRVRAVDHRRDDVR
jgi:glutathione S-transferase